MAQYFIINAENPQVRLIKLAVEILKQGGVVAYPTDSSYALGCALNFKEAQDKIRQIRGVGDEHLFTLVCKNLSELSVYAQVDNSQYRLLKANTPGPYTYILKATREMPRRLQHPKRLAVGIRVPQHNVAQALLEMLDEPMLSMTLQLKDADAPISVGWEIREQLERQLDCIIDSGACVTKPSTIIDLTGETPELIRLGAGDPAPFGL